MIRGVVTAAVLFTIDLRSNAADPFKENVRTTDPLPPSGEQRSFHLPPGFEIQLVAAEPDIAKPMNMAFDERGRIWITDTVEYPFPAPLDQPGRDTIKILEDTNGDGRADKVTTFVEGLNIPIGIYPYKGGVIAWSIPNIWYFQDTDGDGKADRREVLFGPLGWKRDTHGNNASFRRGYDGWLYITHGFNNESVLRGNDGTEIRMNSGNVYRVQADGSRVEQFTWGQVNPFGLCFDPLGNLYSADCHSAPIYQLLRGGYYPSFGKPDDGLGFAPVLMRHSHGSTAISGIVYYADDRWPQEFHGNIFVGNVMTSRVNRDTFELHGSTLLAREAPDFLRTDDPWFRPVDLQLGPDGALYIADFYNRIIGHYEVPRDHPGRDRHRGRIWRVVYTGESGTSPPRSRYDISQASAAELIAELGHPNLTRRMLAMQQLADRAGESSVQALQRIMTDASANAFQRAHALWLLHRWHQAVPGLDHATLRGACADADQLLRTHAMRVLSEIQPWTEWQRDLVLRGLNDPDASVQRAAADALGQHSRADHIAPLLDFRERVNASDTHLVHVARMALRNQLHDHLGSMQWERLTENQSRAIADVVLGVHSPAAGSFALYYLKKFDVEAEKLNRFVLHAARQIPVAEVDQMAVFVQDRFSHNLDFQLSLFRSIQQGTAQRGGAMSDAVRAWGGGLAGQLIRSTAVSSQPWSNLPIDGMPASINPWFLQMRRSSDGNDREQFLCSLPPGGERLTGVLRSKPFRIPRQLGFFLAGHDGFPANPPQKKNVVRLIVEGSGDIAAESMPPRNDMAQPVQWDLSAVAGKMGHLEVIDGDSGAAYAWLAFGRLTPEVVPWPQIAPSQIARQQQAAADLAGSLVLTRLEPELRDLLAAESSDLDACAAAARALVAMRKAPAIAALAPLIGDASVPVPLRRRLSHRFSIEDHAGADLLMAETMRSAPYRAQVKLAESLASSGAGAEQLLQLVSDGIASPRVLVESSVRDRLAAALAGTGAETVRRLTRTLSPVSAELEQLISSRRAAYSFARANPINGARVYNQNCVACHSIGGQGGSVGPQLDGIGNRGLDRILEDLLDPNRNVDRAFRTHIFTLKDGDIISGLPRREEGESLVIADSTGKENSIQTQAIESRFESESSLMPSNFGELLSADDCRDLLAYLLAQGGI